MKTLGIIGGMGPLASAEFVNTLYECANTTVEQEMPSCLVASDPSFPDRTTAILNGEEDELINRLQDVLRHFQQYGIRKTVICCITIHHFLPRLAPELRRQVLSLIDVIIDDVLASNRRHLLLCTIGTRRARIFQNHQRWRLVESLVRLPAPADQQAIHESIYRIKQNHFDEATLSLLDRLHHKYDVDAFIAGCTEIHVLSKHLANQNARRFHMTDPLLIVAQGLEKYLAEPPYPHALEERIKLPEMPKMAQSEHELAVGTKE